MDLSQYSDQDIGKPLRLLFIHHSTGGQLLADKGPIECEDWICWSHPNGGGLRERLTKANYEVHEASYRSRVGENTDLFDWLPKFANQMEFVLRIDSQDTIYEDSRRNQIVIFKSCFPNNNFLAEGEPPGDPAGSKLTVWNARATFSALLYHFTLYPDVLFVYFTAPPLAKPGPEPVWKWAARKVLSRPREDDSAAVEAAALAREFNNWVSDPEGWLRECPGQNVVVFDYYDILTNKGQSNNLAYPSGDGHDDHPSAEGNLRAAVEFVPFLNQAVRRAGLLEDQTESGTSAY